MRSSAAAVALLLKDEGFVGRPYWPGGVSGVTLDYGYDLGYHDDATFTRHWSRWLTPDEVTLLGNAVGYRGAGASHVLTGLGLTTIAISVAAAQEVFTDDSLPAVEAEVLAAMPGADELPPDAFGALADLIYNRGPAMGDGPPQDPRRLEMRAIRSAVAAYAATTLPDGRAAILEGIAHQLDLMGDRLWPDLTNPLDRNLNARRHAEAALVRQATP